MISIITPFHGGLDLLPDYEHATIGAQLIIIDNASDALTADALATLPPDRGMVLRNAANTGFSAANNQGYVKATGDIIIFLNSDVAGDPAWLSFVADDVRDGALYGPSLQQQLVYGRWLPYLEGWCIAATRATWDELCWPMVNHHETTRSGPWDEHAYPGVFWEDNDLCYRAMDAGIGLIQTQWPIQHKGGRTTGPIGRHGASYEANRATFAARVGESNHAN